MILHATGCFVKRVDKTCKPYGAWKYLPFPLGLYIIERIIREVRAHQNTYITKIVRHPSDTYEIQFKKPAFKYVTGQYIFINCPSVRRFEWHPFTLTSCPYEDYISVHIRILGDWTEGLGKAIGYYDKDGQEPPSKEMPRFLVDGPYGTPSQEVFDYENVVLVGAGIGVTPFASILKAMWFRHHDPDCKQKIKRIDFFWVCRSTKSFEWFQNLLRVMEEETSDQFLRVHIYLTGKLDEKQLQNVIVNADEVHDAITDLKSQTLFGRPDFDKFFYSLRHEILTDPTKKPEAGVFLCGPYGIRRVLQSCADKYSNKEFTFRLHAEKF
jgi:NADPH oxidase